MCPQASRATAHCPPRPPWDTRPLVGTVFTNTRVCLLSEPAPGLSGVPLALPSGDRETGRWAGKDVFLYQLGHKRTGSPEEDMSLPLYFLGQMMPHWV